MKNRWITTPLLAFMLTAGVAAGQDAQPAAEPKPEPQLIEAPSINATYSDEEIASIAKKLTGSWISAQPITELDGDGEAKIVMTISAARVQGLEDMLYCEIAREDKLDFGKAAKAVWPRERRSNGLVRKKTRKCSAAAARARRSLRSIPQRQRP